MSDTDKKIREDGLESFGRYYGIYKGFVASNNDPDNLGRLQLKVPQIYGDDIYDYWALPKGVYSGNGVGSFFIPYKDDFVWVQFENGDPRFPVWDYGWWSKNSAPKGAKPSVKIIQTNSGHRIEMDDDNKSISIIDANGNIVNLNKDGIYLKNSGDTEQAVKGNTCVKLLNDMLTDFGKISAISTSSGVTFAINTSPNWVAFSQKWKNKFKEILSKEVNLE